MSEEVSRPGSFISRPGLRYSPECTTRAIHSLFTTSAKRRFKADNGDAPKTPAKGNVRVTKAGKGAATPVKKEKAKRMPSGLCDVMTSGPPQTPVKPEKDEDAMDATPTVARSTPRTVKRHDYVALDRDLNTDSDSSIPTEDSQPTDKEYDVKQEVVQEEDGDELI